MRYNNIEFAEFIDRPNRFIAHVLRDGEMETVHVKNTGRCKELLLPHAKVVLQKSDNPSRKTAYDLIGVYKENLGWVNIDSQVPNKVVMEWLQSGKSVFEDMKLIRPEYTYGKSRVDFYIECEGRKILMEVKGCTLEIEGEGFFPDAPTERGVKHLKELQQALEEGYESYLAFVIAMPGVTTVKGNAQTHLEFAQELERAREKGVKILMLPCVVEPDKIEIE